MTQKITNFVAQWEANNSTFAEEFSGVISVTGKDGTIYEKVQGVRNKGESLPNERDTAFGIASGGKLFTAVATCQLIEQGYFTLDSKIVAILPHDLGTVDKETTVLHLLTHSSGIADYLDFDTSEEENTFFNTHPVSTWASSIAYLPFFNTRPNAFALGSKTDYSNSNFILLGLIIEAVSGKSYHEYINKNIIAPLNMTHTGFYATNNLPANTAVGYAWDKHQEIFVGNCFRLPVVGAGDGGLYTTATDMTLFWNGLFQGKLLSQDMLKQFLTPRTWYDDIEGNIGLGVFINERNGKTIYWHDGADAGVGFHTAYFPDTGNVMTVFSNFAIKIIDFCDQLMTLLANS